MTDKITLSVVHGASQFIIATVVGKVVDGVLPYKPSADNVLQLGTEVVLQIAADVIITAGLMEYLNNYLTQDQMDPSGGFAYIIGLLTSQPSLMAKIGRLNLLISQKLKLVTFSNIGNSPMGVSRVPVTTENQFISGNAAYN